MEKRLHYTVGPEDTGKRLGEVLRTGLGLTTHQLRSVKFTPGGLTLNGETTVSGRLFPAETDSDSARASEVRPVTTGTPVKEGDVVTVCFQDGEQSVTARLPEDGGPAVLYEDDDLVFFDKPAGMVCHPAGEHSEDTLANFLAARYREPARLIGRLDKDTSGAIGCCRNSPAVRRMELQRSEGILRREYLALVHGEMVGSGVCGLPLKRVRTDTPVGKNQHPLSLMKPAELSEEGALWAGTEWEALEVRPWKGETITLLRLHLLSGRMHQIRAHMSALGHPLLGDPLYGEAEKAGECPRTMLHSHRIQCRQPFTGAEITVEAPWPDDMSAIWNSAEGKEIL